MEYSAANPTQSRRVIRQLAACFLAGMPDPARIRGLCSHTFGREWRWLRPVVGRFLSAAQGGTRPRHREAVRLLSRDPAVRRALRRLGPHLRIVHWTLPAMSMLPVAAAAQWPVPRIESAGALADWLWLEPAELDWFADRKQLGARAHGTPLEHYRFVKLTKTSGAIRLIEAPKPRLKAIQRQILDYLLNAIPVHPAVHGFVTGRSIRTFASPHIGQAAVLRMDLNDFFPNLRRARIARLFRTVGYPETVAELLSGICTNLVPAAVWNGNERKLRELYRMPHLPQGAPTSPALANLCAYCLDCRLFGLAESLGAVYTRYADDLAFSGDRVDLRLANYAAAILLDEGFAPNYRKTRLMRQGVRQHLASLVVNRKLSIARPEFDLLRAILTNCARLGPESQNRSGVNGFQAHLDGRIGFVESIDPSKGQRLREIWRRITWDT